jgi:hypothetical protein
MDLKGTETEERYRSTFLINARYIGFYFKFKARVFQIIVKLF